MDRLIRTLAASLVAGITLPGLAYADNTACANAIEMVTDSSQHTGTFTSPSENRWFRFVAKAGRSYAIMAEVRSAADVGGGVVSMNNPASNCAGGVLPGGAVLTEASGAEPAAYDGSTGAGRFILTTGTSGFVTFVAIQGSNGEQFAIRVEDTTLFSNWFYTGGDYGAYTMLRNTTSGSVNFAINWRDSTGTILATFTGTLPANGSVYKNGHDFAAVAAAGTGTVDVIHNGSPDAIAASSTVLSSTTGLSFDSPFLRRGRR